MATPLNFAATQKNVILHLTPADVVPAQVPFQLQDHIPAGVWSLRTTAITETTYRFSKPMLEKFWVVLGLLSVFLVPSLMYHLVLGPMLVRSDEDLQDTIMSINEARGIAAAMIIGIGLFFTLPLVAWKWIGRRKISSLISLWEKSDIILKGQNVPRAHWAVTPPRLFMNNVTITITAPHTVSNFHPNAYLPNYINPAIDSGSAYFYPYQKNEPGLPHMSVIGNVPLYMDEKDQSMKPMFTSLKGDSNV